MHPYVKSTDIWLDLVRRPQYPIEILDDLGTHFEPKSREMLNLCVYILRASASELVYIEFAVPLVGFAE